MLPPILEVVVVWHPDDDMGENVARRLVGHFHGTTFSGLIGGAVEVFTRSQPWTRAGGPPRPVALPDGSQPPNGLAVAEITAVVPVLGDALVHAVQTDPAWRSYLADVSLARTGHAGRLGVFPLDTGNDLRETAADDLLTPWMRIGSVPDENAVSTGQWLRDLAQGLAQLAAGRTPLQVFISHTRQGGSADSEVLDLTDKVRDVLGRSRLQDFFDAHTLQPDQDWREQLRQHAADAAVLCLRSDLYATRAWCQEEVVIAKRKGASVVILDALERGEERGSFLLDHAPRVPVRRDASGWGRVDVERAVSLLVDECLKRALWRRQEMAAADRLGFEVAWWAPHAPEPLTLATWLADGGTAFFDGREPVRILHPDPPLAEPEREVLNQLARLAGATGDLDLMTPRQLAARGGGETRGD